MKHSPSAFVPSPSSFVLLLSAAACLAHCGPQPTNTPPDGSVPTDARAEASAPDAAPDSPSTPAGPTPQEWMTAANPDGPVDFTLEGFGQSAAQGGQGIAQLNIGPIGAPSNAYIVSVAWENFLGSGTTTDCRAGFLFNQASGAFTFSSDPLLTQPCMVGSAPSTSTLTFTGGTVTRSALGRVNVRLNVTGVGTVMGTGTMTLAYQR